MPLFPVTVTARKNSALSEIDRIGTAAAADTFLRTHMRSYEGFRVAVPVFNALPRKNGIYQYFADSLSLLVFSKSDIDQNGKTDLLINGTFHNRSAALLVLDKGKGHFECRFFGPRSSADQHMVFMRFNQQGAQPVLDHYLLNVDRLFDSIGYRKFTDEFKAGFLTHHQLVYRYGFIVEAKQHHGPPFSMRVLELDKGGIFKEYTHYKIRITKTGKAILAAGAGIVNVLGTEQYGVYISRFKRKDLRRLKRLVSCLDPQQLKSSYNVNAADVPYVTTIFTGQNGNEKKIDDRGMRGTVGLEALYIYMDVLVKKLKWQKTDQPLLDAQWSFL